MARILGEQAPLLPSFGDDSKANLLPFAAVCAGWFVPVLKFWSLVWGVFRPSDYTGGDIAPDAMFFAIACAVAILPWWLPALYYRPRAFEHGRLYEWLGVRWFRKFVPNGDLVNLWRRRREPGFRIIPSRRVAADYFPRTIASEKSHLVLLLAGFGSSWFAWSIGWHGWAVYLGIANVLANLYPVLLQRYTRARLTRLLRR
jgi:hypothetical protein